MSDRRIRTPQTDSAALVARAAHDVPLAARTPCSVLLAALLAACALALTACGNTIQDEPLSREALEPLIGAKLPVYWLGSTFDGLAATDDEQDPGGADTVYYGDCDVGGQYTCVRPLSIVTSPNNSFLPGAGPGRATTSLRGVRAVLAQGGATIEFATGAVVVEIYADTPARALAAARAITPINTIGEPDAPLPPPLPDTGFATKPLPIQEPPGGTLPPALSDK